MVEVSIDSTKCTQCGRCAQVCFTGVIRERADGGFGVEGSPSTCIQCGHCSGVCPSEAIVHLGLDSSLISSLDETARPTYDSLLMFLSMRRSRREFKDELVSRELIGKLIAAGVTAPSGLNIQPVRYTVITGPKAIDDLRIGLSRFYALAVKIMRNPVTSALFRLIKPNIYECLLKLEPLMQKAADVASGGKDMVFYNAPCVLILHGPKGDLIAPRDALFAAQNILLAAETLGLGACVVDLATEPCNRDPRLKDLTGVPIHEEIYATIVLGFPKFRYLRTAPRKSPNVNYRDGVS